MDKILKVEMLYNNRKKNHLAAYALGFFLGSFGAHYFYAGANDWGWLVLILLLATLLTGGGLLFIYGPLVLFGAIHTYFVVNARNKAIYDECLVLIGD